MDLITVEGENIIIHRDSAHILQWRGEGLPFRKAVQVLMSPLFVQDPEGVRVGFCNGDPVFRSVRENEYQKIVDWLSKE